MRLLSLRSLLFFAALLFTAHRSLAQIPSGSDTTSTPVHGAGHNYLGDLVETVNPANGSVSIRIATIIPPGRGLTIPFYFAYDSNGASYLGTAQNGSFRWLAASGITSTGGWSNTVPLLSVGQTNYTVPGVNFVGPPVIQNCAALTYYVLQDPNGNRHDLNISVFGQSGANNGGDCAQGGAAWVATGGEGSIIATTSPQTAGAGRTAVTIQPVTVTDADGTAYSFPAFPVVTSLFATSITDRNGNTVRFNPPSGSNPAYSFSDTIGRTFINDSGFAVNPETVTVAGLTNPYSLSWTTIAAPTFTTTFTNFGLSNCPAPTHSSATVVSSITLPNGRSFSFSYDSAYGMVNKVTYPTGAYVRYVWGMNSQSESGGFQIGGGSNPSSCAAHYDTPVVTD